MQMRVSPQLRIHYTNKSIIADKMHVGPVYAIRGPQPVSLD